MSVLLYFYTFISILSLFKVNTLCIQIFFSSTVKLTPLFSFSFPHFSCVRDTHTHTQVDWESNGGLVKKLPSIREDEEGGDDDPSSVCRAPRSPLRLSRGLSSPVRSPLLPPRPFRAPAEHGRPATLQIPVLSFSGAPPELSPRLTPREKTYVHAHLGLIFTRLHRPDLLIYLSAQICGRHRGGNEFHFVAKVRVQPQSVTSSSILTPTRYDRLSSCPAVRHFRVRLAC